MSTTRVDSPSHTSGTPAPAGAPAVDLRQSPRAKLHPLPPAAVAVNDTFWAPRLHTVRTVTLRQQYRLCEETGRIDNFRRAAGKKRIDFQGRYYNDSDVYKWLEAAAYALSTAPDPALLEMVDGVIAEIAAAQGPDGYLNTYFTFEREGERWTNLTQMHEMYCAGHFIQAAIAHHRATGSRRALDVALRLADHICATFGPGARAGADGHEEIELALVELYRATGDRRYLDEAAFLLDQRGQQPPLIGGSPYHQDHLPVRAQREIVGHAVRATYLAIGMADVYAETGDAALWDAVSALWESAFQRKAYVTGGLGARWQGEAFGADYELPNERAYAETCAAIGGFLWNWRLLLLTGEARYADWMETALYNGILAGISLDGTEYFYQNPLADDGSHRRQPWFGTACCPPNIARLLFALPGYLYATSGDGLWVHHYVAGTVRPGGRWGGGALRVATDYPWHGGVRLEVAGEAPAGAYSLALRIPGWAAGARVRVNGADSDLPAPPGSYATLRRVWRAGDTVELDLPMAPRRITSHPRVASNTGRVALARGPLVYCLEGVDHPGVDLRDLAPGGELRAEPSPALLGGVQVLRGEGRLRPAPEWDGRLYGPSPAREVGVHAPVRLVPLTAVPYYAWANRAAGQMQVWLRDGSDGSGEGGEGGEGGGTGAATVSSRPL